MTLACSRTALLLSVVAAGGLVGAPAHAGGLAGPSLPVRGLVVAGQQSVDTPAKESRTPASVLGTKEERVAKAAANYQQNRAVEAALGFEGLWKDYPAEVDFLFNAAASRFAAGHFAHAVAYTREYLAAKTIQAEARAEADAQLRAALVQTAPAAVTVTLAPGGPAGPITLVAEHIARESGDLRPELLFTVNAGATTTLQLDPGVWALRARSAGYVDAEQQAEVRLGQTSTLGLQLARVPETAVSDPNIVGPKPATEVPPETVRGLKVGFAVGGGVFAAAGLGMLIVGGVGVGKATCSSTTLTETCARNLATKMVIRDAGAMSFGAGLGLAAGGLTWLSKDAATRKKVWIAGAVVGGIATIAGMVAMNVTTKAFNRDNDPNLGTLWVDHYAKHHVEGAHAGVSTLAGFGLGALISSATGLLVQHRNLNKVRVDAAMGRGQAGLTLSGRF